jgi:hypothetical protein
MTETGEEPSRHRSRKNRRRWCRGKEGAEHAPAIRRSKRLRPLRCHWEEKSHWAYYLLGDKVQATWEGTGNFFYRCYHEDYCASCGKILSSHFGGIGRGRCPDFHERQDRAS